MVTDGLGFVRTDSPVYRPSPSSTHAAISGWAVWPYAASWVEANDASRSSRTSPASRRPGPVRETAGVYSAHGAAAPLACRIGWSALANRTPSRARSRRSSSRLTSLDAASIGAPSEPAPVATAVVSTTAIVGYPLLATSCLISAS
jgi:hypothetical protein